MVYSTTCDTPHPPASVGFSSPHQSRPSFGLLLLWDSDGEGTAVGFLRPRNSCKPRMALHLFKSRSIMACISTKVSYITVHSGVLSGLTLLTSEQMEIIWRGVRPENGLASILLSQARSLKWDNSNKATWEKSGLVCGFIRGGTMNTTKSSLNLKVYYLFEWFIMSGRLWRWYSAFGGSQT